ncbi:unnamed protein product [Paramecium sonneborni]|uniref:Uncharacterized protein n=1 Tax=Paramecium sonneborni TaxID=65129 RepID=A0A8S1Q4U2_9CILI|nr:unnamed protein product [Paramecium sonneborni]
MSQLKCQNDNHEESSILGVCIDTKCKYSRAYCVACKIEFHRGHEDKLQPFSQLNKWIAQSFNYYQNLLQFNGSILQFQNLLHETINLLQFNKEIDIFQMSIEQLTNFVNKLLVVEEIETKVSPQIKQIYQEINVFQSVCKTALQQFSIVKDFKIKEKILLIGNIPQIQTQNIQLKRVDFCKFSEKYRNIQKTQIEKDGKQASGIGYVMCDYLIPKNGESLLRFNYVSGFTLSLGLCHPKKLIESNFQNQQLSSKEHGLYLVQSNGLIYSHLDSSINGYNLKDKIFPQDIIELKINMQLQSVTWIVNQKKIYTMRIDTTQDLYPIADICGVVQIVDEL